MGDRVRVKGSVKDPHFSWRGVRPLDSRGIFTDIEPNRDAPEDDMVVRVDFPEERKWKGLYSEIERVPGCGFEVGDKVQIKSSVLEPSRGWGNVTGSSIGRVLKIEGEEGKEELTIDFPECSNWVGLAKELEIPVKLKKGDAVQVRKTVKTPKLGWKGVSHGRVGELIKMPSDSDTENIVQVRFPNTNEPWSCLLEELELGKSGMRGLGLLGHPGLGMRVGNGLGMMEQLQAMNAEHLEMMKQLMDD
ncbi:uncharacterized protein [Watersipora subatra]|uniref:uncharacterized protein n=1 Tax=Watersipora subatra TaxID=2589382 RepID=UPI00355C596C